MEPRKWFEDSRWLSIGVDDDGALYYMDKESRWKDDDGIKVEIRAIPLQGNNQSDIPTGTSYIYQLWKVYPNKHVFDLLNFRFYDANGRLIPSVPHQVLMEIEIKPGSVAEKIKAEVCGDQATKGTAKSSKEEFRRQREEASGHETFPFLTGTTLIVVTVVILVVGTWLGFYFYNAGSQSWLQEGTGRQDGMKDTKRPDRR